MKYSFMTFSTPDLDLDGVLALARQLGYDGVEPRLDAGHRHGVETTAPVAERAAIRRRAEDAGVALCCLATSCSYSDPARTADQIEATRRALALAGDVGCPRLRVFGGAIADGAPRPEAVARLADALRSVADEAAARGVTLCLETHDAWCDTRDVAAVMQRAGHPAVAVNWDIMHPVRQAGQSMEEAFANLRPWIRHVHFHDGTLSLERLEMKPIGQGGIDHGRAVRLLREAGYAGYLSGEWIGWEPAATHLPRELAAVRALEAAAGGAGR